MGVTAECELGGTRTVARPRRRSGPGRRVDWSRSDRLRTATVRPACRRRGASRHGRGRPGFGWWRVRTGRARWRRPHRAGGRRSGPGEPSNRAGRGAQVGGGIKRAVRLRRSTRRRAPSPTESCSSSSPVSSPSGRRNRARSPVRSWSAAVGRGRAPVMVRAGSAEEGVSTWLDSVALPVAAPVAVAVADAVGVVVVAGGCFAPWPHAASSAAPTAVSTTSRSRTRSAIVAPSEGQFMTPLPVSPRSGAQGNPACRRRS